MLKQVSISNILCCCDKLVYGSISNTKTEALIFLFEVPVYPKVLYVYL